MHVPTHTSIHSDGSMVETEVSAEMLTLLIPDLTPFADYTVFVTAETVAVGEQSTHRTIVTLEDGTHITYSMF